MSNNREASVPPIPLHVPEIRGNEWQYIKECLDTNWVSSVGSYVDRFERELASYVGTKYAVAAVNGTSALHLALLAVGIQPDDEVLVSTISFIAPANAIRYIGAWPVFMDAEPDYWQMDPQKVMDFLEKECHWWDGTLYNRATTRPIRAILPVHILGHPVDMDPILEIAHKYDLIVLEDAAECLGAKYKGRKTGTLGDIACFSFNGNKIVTTGGGGMIVTDCEAWAQRAKHLSTQAKVTDPAENIHNEIGYNYRITNLQAAMGCAQMEQIEEYITTKRNVAARYFNSLKDIPGIMPMNEASWAFSIYWLYSIFIDPKEYGKGSRELCRSLAKVNIQTRPLWQPLHESPAHRTCQAYSCDVAERLARDVLSLPSSVGLSKDQQMTVINEILP